MNAWGTSLAVATLLAVSACGGGGGSKSVDSAAAIGRLVGCTTPLKVDTQTMAQEERTCDVRGVEVSIMRAPDRDTLVSYAKLGGAFGANYALVNDHWAISAPSRPLAARLAKRNGWQLL